MSFWTNVSYELESQGISRKELAYLVNVKETTIHKAIRLYKKYSSMINMLDTLTKKEINAVAQLVTNLAK